MYHDMGLVGFLLTPLLCQLPVWYLAPLVFARRPTAWCDLISEVGGSISFSPTFGYAAVADRATDDEVASWDLSSWRVAGCGGELVSPSMYERFAERTAPAGFSRRSFMPSYGLAEAVLAVTMGDLDVEPVVRRISREALQSGDVVDVPIGESAHEVMACGSTIAGVEVCITGSDGRLRGDDKEGAILVRGVSINTPEPAGAPTSEWLATGDVGFVSSSQLYLTGRTKNVVIVDGRNHHIEDVEAACARIAPVRRGNLVAFGVFDGDREALVVVFDPVRGAAVDDVAQKIRHEVWRMTGGVTPIVAPLPSDAFARTSSGKLKRHEIRSRYLELVATQ
jgi:fatty-acyl-CoA synthase